MSSLFGNTYLHLRKINYFHEWKTPRLRIVNKISDKYFESCLRIVTISINLFFNSLLSQKIKTISNFVLVVLLFCSPCINVIKNKMSLLLFAFVYVQKTGPATTFYSLNEAQYFQKFGHPYLALTIPPGELTNWWLYLT